jgi:hypothetical protein
MVRPPRRTRIALLAPALLAASSLAAQSGLAVSALPGCFELHAPPRAGVATPAPPTLMAFDQSGRLAMGPSLSVSTRSIGPTWSRRGDTLTVTITDGFSGQHVILLARDGEWSGTGSVISDELSQSGRPISGAFVLRPRPCPGPLGTWELISRTDSSAAGVRPADGPLGSDPVAWITYDDQGHVSAQLMARQRGAVTGAPVATTVRDPNNSAASGGYDAYFGTYAIDLVTHTVTHHLIGALSPADVGRTLTRHYRVDGDVLLIWFEARRDDGTPVTRRLLWKRIAP